MRIDTQACCDRPWPFIGGLSFVLLLSLPAQAQVTGLNGTTVTPVEPSSGSGNTVLEIGGGQTSDSGTNLFHSFQDFNLGQGITADFQSSPAIANIFARVLGGNASYIDGVLQVSNGTSNLYFINPAGILTGVNARIELPGSFTAATSDRLGFTSGFWDVLGNADVASLEGEPAQFQFSLPQAGAIVNEGSIRVGGTNPSLRLLGGTVLNTGDLSAPEGRVTIVAVRGDRTVNLADGKPVSFGPNASGEAPLLTLQTLPNLLQGLSVAVKEASKLRFTADGAVQLEGMPTTASSSVVSGDVAFGNYPPSGPPLESSLSIVASASIRGGNIQQILAATFDPPPANTFPITLRAGDSITVGDISSTQSNITLTAVGDIQAEDIRSEGLPDLSRVTLRSTNGDIQVNTIRAGSSGVDIEAAGAFRAVGSFPNNIDATGELTQVVNDPGLIGYLVSLGYNQSALEKARVVIRSAKLRSSVAARFSGTGDDAAPRAPIQIRYGDRSKTLVDQTPLIAGSPGRILIQGDSKQSFRLGPAFDGQPVYIPLNDTDAIAEYDPITNNFPFTIAPGRHLSYGTDEFPAGASGLAGDISITAAGDGSLYRSVQDQVFDPPAPGPLPDSGDAAITAQRRPLENEALCERRDTSVQSNGPENLASNAEDATDLMNPDPCWERSEEAESASDPLLRQINSPTMPADSMPRVGRP